MSVVMLVMSMMSAGLVDCDAAVAISHRRVSDVSGGVVSAMALVSVGLSVVLAAAVVL